VKKECHTVQLTLALISEFIAILCCFPFWLNIHFKNGVQPLEVQLLADFLLSMPLLPIIAALRRGTWRHKGAAGLLAVLPVTYICVSVLTKYPGFMAEILGK
jgi:hypothetical protein